MQTHVHTMYTSKSQKSRLTTLLNFFDRQRIRFYKQAPKEWYTKVHRKHTMCVKRHSWKNMKHKKTTPFSKNSTNKKKKIRNPKIQFSLCLLNNSLYCHTTHKTKRGQERKTLVYLETVLRSSFFFFFFLFLRTKKHKNVFGCWLFPRQVFGDCYESSVFWEHILFYF